MAVLHWIMKTLWQYIGHHLINVNIIFDYCYCQFLRRNIVLSNYLATLYSYICRDHWGKTKGQSLQVSRLSKINLDKRVAGVNRH